MDNGIVFLGVMFAMLIIFIILESHNNKHPWKVGHHTGAIIVIGALFSIIYYFSEGNSHEGESYFEFKPAVYWNLLVPPLIFNAGYNMNRKMYFLNFGNIFIFGVLVTITCFIIYSGMTYYVIHYMGVNMTRYRNDLDPSLPMTETEKINMSLMDIFLWSASLLATDVVEVDFAAHPNLYATILGEVGLNNNEAIVLFNTLSSMKDKQISKNLIGIIIGDFILVLIVSILAGIFFGVLGSLMFKYLRWLSGNSVLETFLFCIMGLLSYYAGTGLFVNNVRLSGICIYVTGIIFGHYAYYNLSPQGKAVTKVTISFMGHAGEAGIWCYVGLALYSSIPGYWSWSFIGWELLIIVVGRIIAVIFCFYLIKLCYPTTFLTFSEVMYITFYGMIRGAVAFANAINFPWVRCEGTEYCEAKKYY